MGKFFTFRKKIGILLIFFSLIMGEKSYSQSACIPTCSAVTSFTANLSSNPNNTYTVSSVRNGKCCHGVGSDACVVFYVTVHPSATEIKFFKSGGNNGTYQINCGGTIYNPTDPVCLNGLTNFCLTYCNPGNNNDTYTITTSSGFSATPNFSLRAGCSGTMSVSGLNPNSITWTSITGSVQGLYNSYLSCTSGSNCMTPVVTPTASTPSFIDYMVCGTKAGCASGTVCDTVRVFTTPGLTANITPTNPVVCSGGASTLALTATVSGGAPPYTYTWSTGATTQSVGVGVGTYTVNINDGTQGCAALQRTITVGSAPSPTTPPASANTPLCAGTTLSLSTVTSGGTYTWTGPNSFSSTAQNPTIAGTTTLSSGVYSVITNVAGCSSNAGTVAVSVLNAPTAPSASANTPICALQTLSLNAGSVSGAVSYSWTGPNGFTSSSQNATIASISTSGAGTYSVFASNGTCSGPAGTVAVTVNPAPATPTAAANSPLCAGQTLSLLSQSIASATYNWSGPNGFTSTNQNPTLSNVTIAATGVYSVNATVAGCAGASGTVAVTVNPIPAAPVAGGNSPLCTGQTLSLSATSTGVTYNWSGPNGFTSTSQNPSITNITLAGSGVYSVNTTSAGCTSPNGTVNITVNQTPGTPTISANSPLCIGQTLNLSATSTVTSFSWSGPNGFTSALQNPSISNITTAGAGVYSLTGTSSGCASPTATLAVTVNTLPAAPTPTSNSPVCAGNNLTLGSSNITGASYNWTGPNGFTSSTQTNTITGATTAATGIYSITATVNGCTGPAGTVSVTVNPIPAAPTPGSNSPLCAGQTLSLTASTIASATYSWSGPNGFTSTSQNPSIINTTTLAAGTYTLRSNVLGCTSSPTTIAVTINSTPAAPIAGANTTLCAGGTINLTASGNATLAYNWTGPNGFTSNTQNPSITNASTLATGMYSVTATANGCTSAFGTVSVSVFGNPAAPTLSSNSPVCTGQSLTFSATPIGGASYSWTGPNGFTSSVQNPTITNVTLAANGTYSVGVNVSGCGSAAATIAVVVNPTPSTPTISANTPLCVGQTLNLSAATSGTAFSWTGPNGFTSTSSNPSVSNITTAGAGVYSVSATSLGCPSATGTLAVTVNTLPAAPTPTSNSPVCAGSNLTLGSSNITGASYNWTGPNGFTSSTQSNTITGATTAATGIYSITATVNGCTGAAGTISVTVNPIPAALTPGSNAPICAGQTLSLTSSASAGTYSWTGPNGFSSTNQNPTIVNTTTLASGTYTLRANVLGCLSSATTIAVTINPTPAAPIAGANTTLCVGGTINLTASGNATLAYNWTGPNGFTSNTQNPSITNASTLATGMYSVTATANGCTSAFGTVSVSVFGNPAAPTLSSNSPVCTGQSLTFSATPIGGASYSWTGPNGFTSSVQNPTITNVTLAANGTYSVGVNVSGCGSAAATIAVVVNPTPSTPTISANTPLCVGQTLNLSAATSGTAFSWTGPNGFTSTSSNPSVSNITTAGAGVYSVSATSLGCPSATGTLAVTVNTLPAAPTPTSNSPVCAGSNLTLGSSNITGASYNWTGPNGFTSSTQSNTITGATTAATGIYSITATVNGCTGAAGTISVTVNPIPAALTPGSNAPICAGQTLSLTSSASAGTYSWTGPNGFSSTNQNPTIVNTTTLASGTYTLRANVLGCLSSATTIAVTINPTPAAPIAGANTTLCVGGTINLTASGNATLAYNWTGPNGFTSNTQNPSITNASTLATGMYSVTATANGCTSAFGTVSVSVFGNPAAPTLSSNSPVCTGQSLTFSATPIGGASYSWTGPNGFTSSVQNPTITNVTLAANGTYSVGVNVSGCGSAAATISVIVNPTPAAPLPQSNSPICDGQTINLNVGPAGPAYSWTGPNGFNSLLDNPSITNAGTVAAGAYSVTSTVNGCTSLPGIVNVTVNSIPASPNVTSNSPVCENQNLTFSISPGGASYSWSGPNGFTSALQNPTITAAQASASGSYSVTSTVLGCTSAPAVISVTVSPPPAPPVPGSNSPICAFQTLSLTASTVSGAGYLWTGPNSFTSTSQDPSFVPTSSLSSGVYTVVATVAGCNSAPAVISVTVNQAPNAPVPSSNSPLCIGQTLNLNATNVSGATYSWTGPNGYSSGSQNNSIPNATPAEAGTYSVTATLAGCTSSVAVTNVSVTLPATLTVGSSPTVCANSASVSLNGTSTTGSGTWSATGGTFTPNSLTGTFVPNASQITAGIATLTLTSTNNGGCAAQSQTLEVNITPAPTAFAGGNQTVCANNSNVNLSGSVTVASGGIWSSSGTGSFTPNNTSLNATYVPSGADISAGTFTLALTTSGNGNCVAVTNSMVVSISPAPVVNGGPSSQIVCKNNPNHQFNATSSTGTASWTTMGSGSFSPNSNILNPTYIPSTADTTNGSVVLILTSTGNGGCNPVSQTITLVYTSTLSVDPGLPQTVCSNNATVALNGISTTSAGVWTSSGTGSFSPSSGSLATTYVPSAADILSGSVTLTLTTANNGGCNPISNTTTVSFVPGPAVDPGMTQTVCANNATVSLSGSFSVSTGAQWSSSGTGTFTPDNITMNATYIASAADTTAGSVYIYLTSTGNGNCFAEVDSVLINFTPAPLVNAGANASACKTNPNINLNGYSSTGSVVWSTLGAGTFTSSNTITNPTYIPGTADTTAGSVVLVLTSDTNGGCNAVSDTIILTYGNPPSISAGVSQTVCANNSTVTLNGVSSTGSGTWTTGGGGTFSPNNLGGTYVPNSADILAGSVTLSVTSTNNAGCAPAVSEMTVFISPAPTAMAGVSQTVCANTLSVSLNGSVTVASGGVWTSSGTGTFVPDNLSLNTAYMITPADTTAGSVTLYLTTSGNGLCNSVTDSVQIFFNSGPLVNAGNNLVMCSNATAVNLNGFSSTGSGTWTTLGSGSFSPNGGVLNASYSPSQADTTAGNVVLVLTSENNGGCGSSTDTVQVSFNKAPMANFNYKTTCLGSAISFTDASAPGTGTLTSWLWNYNNGDTSMTQNPLITFTASGSHTISLLVNNGNCADSVMKTVYVNPNPVANYSYSAVCSDSAKFRDLSVISTGIVAAWSWDFGDSNTSLLQNPAHMYADSGMYIVTLTILSDSNCAAMISDTVYIQRCNDIIAIGEPAVPSGFTPNGDGHNDVLYVKGGPYTTLNFRIFNEWGQQIFESTEQSKGWDGTFKNSDQPVGVFVWTVDGELIDGRKIRMAGEVLLSR